jgi:NitT/TauT family transport system ATP-binding protein
VLAGLVRHEAGQVEIRADRPGRPLTAMVFQDHALLPWRTVLANVAFGPENRGWPRAECEARARQMLALVGLTPFARAYPHQLSGGMKQRVGIARALAQDPEVLLMDEPLAALDAQTRALMQEELLRLWTELGATVVYVTHSLEEALLLGDRVALLTARPGRIKRVFPVPLPRPRGLEARASPEFGALLDKLWAELREEVLRAAARPQDGEAP